MPFETLRTRSLPAMQAELLEFEHRPSGARHIHLATRQQEQVFLVAFPTLPESGDGRAHILEHLTLCGSARYPVRDPFFAMLRRSTAHFMNAMTYPDRTVYPFATTDRADFFNLLDVYLDAAFFPHLDYLDFRQEGWRYAFEGGRLVYQGVVFNEMKGAFASPQRAVEAGLQAVLFEGTTYAVESGGDPLLIPELTHEQLRAFHAEHYHPSQAVFMSAGNIEPEEIQKVLEDRVLARCAERRPFILPPLARAWDAPRQASVAVPSNEYGVQIAWLMGESADPRAYCRGQLLDDGLLGNAAAPVMQAMETAGFGRPATINGIDDGRRQLVFHLGMEGLSAQQVEPARRRIWEALERAAEQGVPHEVLRASLRDLRFSLRDMRDGHTPYLLSQLLHALPYAMYGGDVLDALEAEDVLRELERDIADPAFFKGMVRALLEAPTRLDLSVQADPDYFARRQREEDARLAALQARLTPEERARIEEEARALQARQRQPVDNGILPRIRPSDIAPEPRALAPLPPAQDGVIAAVIASNGISHARVVYDVSHFEEADWPWLQLYVDVLPELGVGEMDYEQADAWRHAAVPRFDVGLGVLPQPLAPERVRAFVEFRVRGLREERDALAEVLTRSIAAPRFDEHERLAYLIDSATQDARSALADEGDDYARLSACAPLTAAARLDEAVDGVRSLAFLAELHAQSQTPEGIAAIAGRLEALHRKVIAAPARILCAGQDQDAAELARRIVLPRTASVEAAPLTVAPSAGHALALHAPAQVNHCYAAWRVPGMDHPDAPALAVLAELVTNLVLHQSLREEGGAYGGQAYYSPLACTFVMMSYRDPRLAETYAEFRRALEWIAQAEPTREQLEEAIVCVIQGTDRPRTPFAELMRAWTLAQQGVSEDMRRRFRRGVLECTPEQAREAARRWLDPERCSRAAFVGHARRELAGLELVDLARLAGDSSQTSEQERT